MAEAGVSPVNTRRAILHLAWPVIVANFLQTLIGSIDLIMVGGLGAQAVASVGLGGQILFFGQSLMIATSVGTLALTARAWGAKDPKEVSRILWNSVLIGLGGSLLIMAVAIPLAQPILSAFGAEASVAAGGATYLQIVLFATPAIFFNFLAAAALRGMGDTRTPMLVGVLVNVVNVVGNYLLIYGNFGFPRLGIAGSASSSLTAFIVGALAYLGILFFRSGPLREGLLGRDTDRTLVRRIGKLAAPAALEQVIIQTGFMIYVIIVVAFGTTALAAHQIGISVQSMAFMPGFGFSVAATALVGQNLGAKNPPEAERSGWEAVKLAVLVMGLIGLTLWVAAPFIARVYVQDAKVVELATTWIRIHALSIPATGMFFTLSGSLRGAGDTRWPLYASSLGIYGVRIPLSLVLGFFTPLALLGVWMSLVVEYYLRAAIIAGRFRSGVWKAITV